MLAQLLEILICGCLTLQSRYLELIKYVMGEYGLILDKTHWHKSRGHKIRMGMFIPKASTYDKGKVVNAICVNNLKIGI